MEKIRKIGILGLLLILVNTLFFFVFQDSIIPFLLNMSIAIYLFSFLFRSKK